MSNLLYFDERHFPSYRVQYSFQIQVVPVMGGGEVATKFKLPLKVES